MHMHMHTFADICRDKQAQAELRNQKYWIRANKVEKNICSRVQTHRRGVILNLIRNEEEVRKKDTSATEKGRRSKKSIAILLKNE